MKRILGLDLGTNSIGWALVEIDHEKKILKVIVIGSRIIPMDGQEFSKFNAGQKIESAAGNRTKLHRARLTKERYLLRRDRLHLVLNLIDALPSHYKIEIDFERNGKKCGQFKEEKEPKIAYLPTKNIDNKFSFYYEEAFKKMIEDLQKVNPNIKNEKGKRIPKDWTIYYLRNKALNEKVSLEEFAWILLSYNQKRGYEQMEIEDENEKSEELKETLDLKVIKVEHKNDKSGKYDEITLNDTISFEYKEYTTQQLTFEDDIKEVVKITKLDDAGNIIENQIIYQISDLYNLTLVGINHAEIDDKNAKHKYDFVYTNGWNNEKKTKQLNASFQRISKEIKENNKIVADLFVVKNSYDINGIPESIVPNIKIPDFNSEGSKDWTLLKKKTEKDIIKFAKDSNNPSISEWIYNEIIKKDVEYNERTKIIGGIFQTIDRKFYRIELNQIINKQRNFHKDTLDNKNVFEKCVKLLYPHNEDHSKTLLENKNAITHLLVDDILLYQRPLKSKKSEIGNCKHEIDYWKEEINTTTGEIIQIPIYKKAVSTSHPLYQEFRIWDKIHSIKLIQLESKDQEEKSQTNIDVTSIYFKTPEDYIELFNHFNKRKCLTINDYLEFCKKRFKIDIGKKEDRKYVWNYPIEEEFKGNETRKSFEIRFKRCGFNKYENFLTKEKEIALWHYLYSVSFKDRKEIGKTEKSSIQNFFIKYFKDENIDSMVLEKLCIDFSNYPKFNSKYGAYSVKALNKLLSVMRVGRNFLTIKNNDEKWKKQITSRVDTILERVQKIDWTNNEIDYSGIVETIVNQHKGELPFPKGLLNTFKDFKTNNDFIFLNLTQASYLIYGRHSELAVAKFWDSPSKIRDGINKELTQHSLNNPIAEKVLKETMKVVADIWEYYGNSLPNFFSSINIEVARELQKSNDEKKEISDRLKNSRKENERLRSILEDFLCNSLYNAKKGNQDHFERLKIVENGAIIRSYADKDFYTTNSKYFSKKEIEDLLKKQKISKTDFEKYKLWVEQGYRSPYTGKTISFSNLFDGKLYNIDHILPRASVTNDSLNNKVVCEKEINKEKTDYTGRAFVSNFQGKKFYTVAHGNVNIISEEQYVELVKAQFKDGKRFILLSKEVPSGFTDSQMNNAKHIARKAMELLSHIVREPEEVEFRSKNVVPVSGIVTDKLKKEWKLNQVWVELLTSRFERLNKLHNTDNFGGFKKSENGHIYYDINTKFVVGQNNNFELKRIDQRHHALDALIIALSTENHIQYLNNINSGISNNKKEKLVAIKKQRAGIKRQIMYSEPDKKNPNDIVWKFMLPGSFRMENINENGKESVCEVKWCNQNLEHATNDFKKVILNSLEHCIVTFKNDFKLVTKSSNKYESYYDENGNLKLENNGKPIKGLIGQKNTNNKHWSIRKPLHQDNPRGKVTVDFDRLIIYENLGKAELIKDERIRNKVNEILEMFNRKISSAKSYLKNNPITIENHIIEHTDFKISNVKYRKRQPITDLARRAGTGKIENYNQMIDRIYKVVDIKLRNDLLNHLRNRENDIDKAFSIEGIDEFNSNRKIPVKRLPIAESGNLRFSLGEKNNNKHKMVEAEQYTNLYFRITKNETDRSYETVTLRDAIRLEKFQISNNDNEVTKDEKVIILSPNDLVYIPTPEEQDNSHKINFNKLSKEQIKRIYKFVSCTESEGHFIPYSNATEILKNENGTNSKNERMQDFFDGNTLLEKQTQKAKELKPVMIKSVCIKLKIDRLGNISN